MEKELIYLICPVRNVTPSEKTYLDNYVDSLEKTNKQVHYPPRDVNQIDDIGLRILTEHREAMKKSNEVHVYWNPSSNGSFFDFGMAYMAGKIPHIINPQEVKEDVEDFARFVLAQANPPNLEHNLKSFNMADRMNDYKEFINDSEKLNIYFTGLNKKVLFELGMAFFSEKPLFIQNRTYLETQKTSSKSFQNVLLELDSRYRKAL